MKIKDLKKYTIFDNEKLKKLEKLENQGVCNTIYKLDTSKKKYLIRVFKLAHQNKKSRHHEFEIQEKAHNIGIAAKPYILDEKKSLMICDFLKGTHKKKLTKQNLNALVDSMKKLNKIKVSQKTYKLKKDFQNYKKILKDKNSQKLIKDSFKELKKLEKYKFEAVNTHHDLNMYNVLFYKNKARFIDWEFARVNDRFFDIANICFEFKLNKKQEQQVLKRYFKKLKNKDIKKLSSYKKVYKNLWILWFRNQNIN